MFMKRLAQKINKIAGQKTSVSGSTYLDKIKNECKYVQSEIRRLEEKMNGEQLSALDKRQFARALEALNEAQSALSQVGR